MSFEDKPITKSDDACSRCSLCTSDEELSNSDSEDSDSLEISSSSDSRQPMVSKKWECDWEIGEEGGTLQAPGSSVQLHIPRGAVKGRAMAIHAAVCGDLESIYSLLWWLCKEEYIGTPFAEYSLEDSGCKFECPVTISLPHFLPPDLEEDDINVYCVRRDDDGKLMHQLLNPAPKRTEDSLEPPAYADDCWSFSPDGE
jgi:hypothetical protein